MQPQSATTAVDRLTEAPGASTAAQTCCNPQALALPVLVAGVRPGVANQPAPKPSRSPSVWMLVQEDFRERTTEGVRRYGVPLSPFNGRDVLTDAYQEAIDLCMYLRQLIYERDGA